MSLPPRLALPFLAAGQSQKHVTLNEALLRLDGLVQIRALSRAVASPPGSAVAGDAYLVPAGASGAWSGQTGKVARFQDGGWVLLTPAEGWLVWVQDEALFLVHRPGHGAFRRSARSRSRAGESIPERITRTALRSPRRARFSTMPARATGSA